MTAAASTPDHRAAMRRALGRRARRQHGQVLVWFLGTLATSAAVLYGVYNVAQVTAAKQQTTNAADAAALAGGMVQARALNYMAYTNRAVIANEAFVAQMLSLESWVFYVKTATSNLGTVTSFIPYVGQVVGPVLREISSAANAVGQALDKSVDVVIGAVELFKAAQLASTVGAVETINASAVLMARGAANNVVAANKTTFGGRSDTAPTIPSTVDAITFAKNEVAWTAFTKRYAGNDRANARDAILASRDGFSSNRPGSALMNFSVAIAGLDKRGSTELKGYDRWEAQDYLELWTNPLDKSYVPIGWGRATADRNGRRTSVTSPGGKGHKATRAALNGDTKTHGKWTGVPVLRDLDIGATPSEAQLQAIGLDYLVVTTKAGSAQPTTETLGIAKTHQTFAVGSADMNPDLAAGGVSAIGKARVYFERPKRTGNDWTATQLFRSDGAKEYGSLYSPYWQVRLTHATTVEKEAVAAAMGGAGSGLGLATP